MGDLAHDGAAVAVDAVRELPQMRDRGVGAEIELIEHAGAVRGNVGRAPEHGQRQPAPGFFLVIALEAQLRQSTVIGAAGVRRAHDPVLQGQPANGQGTEQRVGHGGVGVRAGHLISLRAGHLRHSGGIFGQVNPLAADIRRKVCRIWGRWYALRDSNPCFRRERDVFLFISIH
jgi:hypothetical protein